MFYKIYLNFFKQKGNDFTTENCLKNIAWMSDIIFFTWQCALSRGVVKPKKNELKSVVKLRRTMSRCPTYTKPQSTW